MLGSRVNYIHHNLRNALVHRSSPVVLVIDQARYGGEK